MIPIRDDNPSIGTPYVTITLIVVNVLLFLVEAAQGPGIEGFIWKYGYVPAQLVRGDEELRRQMQVKASETQVIDRWGRVRVIQTALPYNAVVALPAWVKIFLCMFLHGGWMHLGGNMLYLWIFGNNVEDRLGPGLFVFFYLATGLAGNLAHTFFGPSATPLVGASGAISGVMGAYILMFPHSRILALLPLGWYWMTVRLPAWVFIGVYYLLQNVSGAVSGTLGGRSDNVAYLAHIGGFAAGAAFALVLPRRQNGGAYYTRRSYDDDDVDFEI